MRMCLLDGHPYRMDVNLKRCVGTATARVGECGRHQSGDLTMAEKPRHPVLAGWIAGSLEIVVTYPLEFVKTQLQLQVT